MVTWLKRSGWPLVTLGAVIVVMYAAAVYLPFDAENYPDDRRESYLSHRPYLYIHIIAGMAALVVGPVQFFLRRLTPLARRHKLLPHHRWLGRAYVVSALVAGSAGLFLAFFTLGGAVAHVGFAILAVLTLATTLMAYLQIRAGDEQSHRVWMSRSYTLIFTAVSLRLWLGLLQGAMGLDSATTFAILGWLSWIPNLLVVEALMGQVRRRQPFPRPAVAK